MPRLNGGSRGFPALLALVVPADLAESLLQGSKVGSPFWNPPVLATGEVRDAVGEAIVTSIQGGDVKAAVNKAAADTTRIMAETEKK